VSGVVDGGRADTVSGVVDGGRADTVSEVVDAVPVWPARRPEPRPTRAESRITHKYVPS